MFIELWKGLLDYYHDNNATVDINNAKMMINWSIQDISNSYDWPYLRGTTTLTASADGVYSLNKFSQLTASANIYAIAQDTSDNGIAITVHGKQISGNSYNNLVDSINCSSSISASASNYYNSLDYFIKPITTGTIVITSGTNILTTLAASDTVIGNDIHKITTIVDGTYTGINLDYNTQLKANPSGTVEGTNIGWDIDYNNQIRLFNLADARTFTIIYQRIPKYLINNNDLTELPKSFYPDIINYAHKVYGLRFQDESDAWNGIASKQQLIAEIIAKHTSRTQDQRVMPSWYQRKV